MKINGVYLSLDLYDNKQMELVQSKDEAIAQTFLKIQNPYSLTEDEKEAMKSEVYSYFESVFGEDKAFEVLGGNPNLTDCVVALSEFRLEFNKIKNTMHNVIDIYGGNRKARRAAVHKRK